MSRKSNTEGPFPGETGYRTRQGRTGLDPIDTKQEVGRIEGHFIRKLFTGQLRTRNPIYLFVMFALGMCFLLLPLASFVTRQAENRAEVFVFSLLCIWPMAAAFLYNVFASAQLRRQSFDNSMDAESLHDRNHEHAHEKKHKHKH